MAQESYSEKVSVNINSSTLSGIDLLVDNGYYSNRSDFINQALRNTLQQHQSTLDRIVEKNSTANRNEDQWFIGVMHLSRQEVERLHTDGQKIRLTGYGVLSIDSDCPEEMLFSAVESIRVKGKVLCGDSVKKHYQIK